MKTHKQQHTNPKPTNRWAFYSLIRLTTCLFLLLAFSTAQAELKVHSQNMDDAKKEVVRYYSKTVHRKLDPSIRAAHIDYPPREIAFLAFKREQKLELWGRNNEKWLYIKTYPFTASSGGLGPKLQEGDKQIPEGIYRIHSINPFSDFHLSLEVSYPNRFDREMAEYDHRSHLGGDIYIHGKDSSVGCLPIGDQGIEELFVLAGEVGIKNIKVIISPFDMRTDHHRYLLTTHPHWIARLYDDIRKALMPFS